MDEEWRKDVTRCRKTPIQVNLLYDAGGGLEGRRICAVSVSV